MTRSSRWVRWLLCCVALTTTGCGLVLDVDPPDPKHVDASTSDLGGRDAGDIAFDEGVAAFDEGIMEIDADVTPVDGGLVALDEGLLETDGGAVRLDGGVVYTDAGVTTLDGAVPPPDAGLVACGGDGDCNDANSCTDDRCLRPAGICEHPPHIGGCNDGNACSLGDYCAAGACISDTFIACMDDLNPCTVDLCDPVRGCVSEPAPDGTSCDPDPSLCNWGRCMGGGCVYGAIACIETDGNPCTADVCEPTTGGCVVHNAPLGAPCMLPFGTAPGRCNGLGTCGP